MKTSIITILLTVLFVSAFAQDITVKGTVKSSEDDKPIGKVEIRLKGSVTIATTTDEDGFFSISYPESSSKTIILIADGFDEQEVLTESSSEISIVMIQSERTDQYGKKVLSRTAMDVENRDGILVMESKDQRFKTWFDARVYFDGAYFFDKEAMNPIGNGLAIRRARFALKSTLWNNWYGEIDLDFAGAEMELKDAYLKYTTDNGKINFKAGNYKEGFSMESTTTSRYLTFLERSLVNEFAPSRHLGINVTVWDTYYTVIGGVHFQKVGELGEVDASKTLNKKQGIDEGYSYTARAVGRPIVTNDMVLHIGGNFSYRLPKTSWEEGLNVYRVSTRSMTSINRKKYLDTDAIPDVKNRMIYGVELGLVFKNFMFQSEYMKHTINRRDDLSQINQDGFYAQAGMLIFGGKYHYNKSEGELTQVGRGQKWGDVELAFRYDYLDLNDFEAQIYGGSANGYTVGVNYYANNNVKFMLNYVYLDHDRYANGKGKLNVGHDTDGVLTTDFRKITEEAGKGGEDFGFVQARIEIDF